ncbi:hypothetical protein CEP10_08460 [Cylindrospermopsis raciborskii S07]|jgi:hypothetical protein|uniref:TPR repeat protein n=4 Tax=Cylindrospermopsis raciborskii TaxID=77022 RepID=A0A853M788_9CYAN|nr:MULTISPECIES: hypothetical protein [Cylindrospermopsis]MBU6344756.1 hypothetical protein [Cyanobacteria bacterium REEB494]EFA69727.1 conserved hypothetical protein [Cylindrospermopsis raciborskii CS-505]KRH95999.1 hypothetical protein ASL19_08770 [Cylindrospermopsis sp. CR12]MBA4445412.1 hypothetical protein [Cylindrospermopsis raciborskii CS-506_C]MBA4449648.1 hypothetical protein [Cylindrospermopsis raciborskii CS-506_D]
MSEERQNQYFNLIDELLKCPNGQEPEVLEAQPELIDSGLIHTMLQVATMFAHEGNQDGAQFLFFIARELAKQLGLYPDLS